eukprot:5841765-Pyramimonas_sp.AAC.1
MVMIPSGDTNRWSAVANNLKDELFRQVRTNPLVDVNLPSVDIKPPPVDVSPPSVDVVTSLSLVTGAMRPILYPLHVRYLRDTTLRDVNPPSVDVNPPSRRRRI